MLNAAQQGRLHRHPHLHQQPRQRPGEVLAWSQTIDHYIEVTAGLIQQAQSGQQNPRPIYIAYDEWNVWYRAQGNAEKLEEIYNFEDALAMGMFFNSFFRHADVVKMANLAQMVNVIAPIIRQKQRGNNSLERVGIGADLPRRQSPAAQISRRLRHI